MAEPDLNPPPVPESPPEERTFADLVVDVSERSSTLVREEIELAKAELSEKASKILRGSAVGAAAGFFALQGLIVGLLGIGWLLGEEVFGGTIWVGLFVLAGGLFLLAALAGLIAYRSVRSGTPPMPEQAIEEAKLTKEMLEKEAS